jgi:tRNA A37 threonylcarbamoyladenosine dehydratase
MMTHYMDPRLELLLDPNQSALPSIRSPPFGIPVCDSLSTVSILCTTMTDTILNGTPSSKEKKYDRQLRLWGSNGQNKLEATHIALFGASATGCEILKNLVLPGGGQFTVIDDKKVEVSDLGVNFFLDEDSLGKSRAERASAFLGELNPDVKGCYIEDVCAIQKKKNT